MTSTVTTEQGKSQIPQKTQSADLETVSLPLISRRTRLANPGLPPCVKYEPVDPTVVRNNPSLKRQIAQGQGALRVFRRQIERGTPLTSDTRDVLDQKPEQRLRRSASIVSNLRDQIGENTNNALAEGDVGFKVAYDLTKKHHAGNCGDQTNAMRHILQQQGVPSATIIRANRNEWGMASDDHTAAVIVDNKRSDLANQSNDLSDLTEAQKKKLLDKHVVVDSWILGGRGKTVFTGYSWYKNAQSCFLKNNTDHQSLNTEPSSDMGDE